MSVWKAVSEFEVGPEGLRIDSSGRSPENSGKDRCEPGKGGTG